MIRLPAFDLLSPRSVDEAVEMMASYPGAVVMSAGTDLLPNMKRGQVTPTTLISIASIPGLTGIGEGPGGGVTVGALTVLRDVAASGAVPAAVREAAGMVASPQIRNTATIGGNLCVDTRCSFINTSEEWRSALGLCLKAGGDVCWVAPKGGQCWAVSSSDVAPAAIVAGASVRLVGAEGARLLPLDDLYRPDGIDHLGKRPDEILTEVLFPSPKGLHSAYSKLRRRQDVDFPMLGVAAGIRLGDDGAVGEARIAFGAISPAPLRAREAEEFLVGKRIDPEVIEEAAALAVAPVRPFDNADLGSRYRKWMAATFVSRVLRRLGPS